MRNMSDHSSDLSRACAHVRRPLAVAATVGAAWVAASFVAGCSAPVHRAAEPAFFHAGRSVDLRPDATFFPPDPRVLAVEDRDIETRAMDRLAYRDEPTLFELDAWPTPARPSLSDRRYLYISDRPNSYLYFGRPNQRSHHSHHRGHTLFQPLPVFDPRR